MLDRRRFKPLADINLYSDYQIDFFDKNPGNIKYVWIFSLLAFIIILMVSLNYSTLSIARASERSVEIGIRKINGGSRISIFRQFMAESIFQTFAATIIALLVVWFLLSLFNSLMGKELIFHLTLRLIINLFLLTSFVGVIAGLYPSLYRSSFHPIGIFRRGTITGSRSSFIRLLVTVQFTIAIFFIISTLLFVKQLKYIHNKDLGIDDKNVVVIPTGLWYGSKEFKEELLRNPKILSVSASAYSPVGYSFRKAFSLSYQGRPDTLYANLLWVDEDFAKTYKLTVTKGQFLQMDYTGYWKEFQNEHKSDKKETEYPISLPMVINETAEKLLGFDDPILQRIGLNVIVGVVKDFHFRPLYYPIEPLVMENSPESIQTMNVRIAPDGTSETLNYIRDTYKKHRNDREFSYVFLMIC